MFGMRWHDLYGMTLWRPNVQTIGPRFAWWRVSSYYGLSWEVGLG